MIDVTDSDSYMPNRHTVRAMKMTMAPRLSMRPDLFALLGLAPGPELTAGVVPTEGVDVGLMTPSMTCIKPLFVLDAVSYLTTSTS